MKIRFVVCVLLLLIGCEKASPHHWVHLIGKSAEPYDEQYQWVDDNSGRSDDCEITFGDPFSRSSGDWKLYVRGQGYGNYKTLSQAQQKCYEDFERHVSSW